MGATAKVDRRKPTGSWWATMTDRGGKTIMRSALSRTGAIQRAASFLTYQDPRRTDAVIALDRLTVQITDEYMAQLEKETPPE